jgi:hypothetical protein
MHNFLIKKMGFLATVAPGSVWRQFLVFYVGSSRSTRSFEFFAISPFRIKIL